MVYDEGFSVEYEELSFFAFSNYFIENLKNSLKTYKSKCYSTCVGWYHNKDKSQWGCYRAFKVGKDPESVTYSTTTKQKNVLQTKNLSVSSNRLNENIIENSYSENQDKNKQLYRKIYNSNVRNIGNTNSFLAVSNKFNFLSKTELLNSSFKQHQVYASHLNKLKKNWHADVHSEFNNLSIKDLNKLAGIPRISEFRFSRKKMLKNYELE